MNLDKPLPLDITVVQQGDLYIVSGKDAPAVHAKMMRLPEEVKNLKVGEMRDGKFTLQKINPAAGDYSAPKTTATAG